MNKSIRFIIIIIFLLSLNYIIAEDIQSGDTESTVVELIEFHDVIYQIWHNAYPNKDIEALKSYLKDINEGYAKIEKAKLPGILRDKQSAWQKGLEEFKEAIEKYNKAATENNEQNLLNAAEELHMCFEKLVRIIRPVTVEIDEFHKILYVIYHKYLPEKQYEQIKATVKDLINKADLIVKTKLPKKYESKEEAYKKASNMLLEKVKKLEETCQTDDKDKINIAIEEMHSAYQELVNIFE